MKKYIFIIIISCLFFGGCSKNYNKKLSGKIWAVVSQNYYGTYLWYFDGKGKMWNINFKKNSDDADASFDYVFNGNKVKLTNKKETQELKMDFESDTSFILSNEKENMKFHIASFFDSIIGNWEIVNKIDEKGLLTMIRFEPDKNCEFSLVSENVYGDLYGGEYNIENKTIKFKGKEKNWGKGEKEYEGSFNLLILSIDSIKIIQNSKELFFTRDKFK